MTPLDMTTKTANAPARRGRRLEHRDRRSIDAEPRPAERGGRRVTWTSTRRASSPSWSTPRSGTASTTSEVTEFDAAIANNELVAPPAGAIGRGDAFVLSIANKAEAHDPVERLVPGVPRRVRVAVRRGPPRSAASRCRTSDGCSSTAHPRAGPISRKAVQARKPRRPARAARRGEQGGRSRADAACASPRRRAEQAKRPPMPVPKTPPPAGGGRTGGRAAAPAPPRHRPATSSTS